MDRALGLHPDTALRPVFASVPKLDNYKHFYKNISAPNNLNIDYTIKINASSGGICQTAISNSLKIVAPPEFPIITTIKDYLCKSDTLLLNVLSKGGAPPFINTWTSDNTNASIDNSRSTIISYDNDLELYVEIIDAMLLILEGKEEYEKCQVLKNKKEECIKIIKQKK